MSEKCNIATILIFIFWMIAFAQGSFAQSDSGFVSITSNITGANIYCDSLFIGITPLSNVILPQGKHSIMVIDGTLSQWNAVRKEQEINITHEVPVVINIDFPVDSIEIRHSVDIIHHDVLVNPRKVEFHPLLVTGGGVAVVSGIATAYFKIKADARYDTYRATGDRGSLDETHRYDTIAAVTLALSQIGLAVVAYCLLSE